MKKVAIPEKMQKFYGIGIILHPDQEMIESVIKVIPYGRIATIDSLCHRLARDHDVNVTCPMRTSNFMKAITETYSDGNAIPFWRVIRKNHMLINTNFTALCVKNLQKEGFKVIQNSKGEFKVQNVQDRLYTF